MADLSQSNPNQMIEINAPRAVERGITRVWKARSDERLSGELIDRVLLARGIQPDEQGQAFLNPSLKEMHDPSLIPDLDRAATRILEAVDRDELIVIFGDYDVDGVTASAILIHLIRAIKPEAKIESYIPHRLDEGYGINSDAIRKLDDDGARVIVSVDCGITAIEPALVAKELGIDLIITDHHNPPATMADLPDAFAVVHPRRPDSKYPFGELCGAGVAYKLAWRMATMDAGDKRVSASMRTVLIDLLGFAALGSIADIVPLVDENRVIVKHGLSRIPSLPNEGLQALIRASGLDSEKIDTEAIGFRLAPRLNAIGRLGHARDALELMCDATGNRAVELAEELSRINDERKKQELATVSQAVEMAIAAGMTGVDQRAIVLAHEGWHPGIVGIVCSRLVDRFARPTILMQRTKNGCKGSGRSIEGFNLHAGLDACKDLLGTYGGHDMAAGMKCELDQFDAFADAFISYSNAELEPTDLVHHAKYDCIADIAELTPTAVRQLDLLAPFGAGNRQVRLRINGLKLNGPPTPMGKTGSHLSMRVGSRTQAGPMIRVVAWNWARHLVHIPGGAPVEMIVEPKISTWNGNTRVEPVLVDLRVV
ncbi:MAG: single-stranded-DNA-specific exonuclease RecJ [Phycisphaerales bacterium]|nr:single-stranded-DNA-specific exonuclease RecJ [Phycisphaerales bacterium]